MVIGGMYIEYRLKGRKLKRYLGPTLKIEKKSHVLCIGKAQLKKKKTLTCAIEKTYEKRNLKRKTQNPQNCKEIIKMSSKKYLSGNKKQKKNKTK